MKKFILIFFIVVAITGCFSKNGIVIKDNPPWYFPTVLEVEPGTTVTWESMAAIVHPISILAGPENVSSGHFTKTYSYTFTKPGMYHYYCPLHPYMQGFIGVGMNVSKESLPTWVKEWPPKEQPIPGTFPRESGIGEVWLDAQFQIVDGKEKPGTVVVIDAETWRVKRVIADKHLNNPHNLWLSDDKNSVLQTNWFDKYLSIIDRYSGLVLKNVYVGESPAHVMTARGKVYVTLQGADGIAVLDGTTFTVLKTIRTVEGAHTHGTVSHDPEKANNDDDNYLGRGPHGNWVSADEKFMAVAHTEGGSVSVWDLEREEKIFEHETDALPLFAGISEDGKVVWTAALLSGKFSVFDVKNNIVIKEFIVGKSPIQAVPSPDGKYILVALSGDGAVAVVDAKTFELIKTLPSGAGAHGITYGLKKNGGEYAYVSHKFVPWITVIDMATTEVAGYIPLPKDSLGGQGILAIHG